ncbi:MAG TPA: glycosyltransferase family 39 protein [Candidatus Sumerlaeota bacterium]|nr:glycosyltransferase family 39 protein [Candidatus Sumerlaeota bacterium]
MSEPTEQPSESLIPTRWLLFFLLVAFFAWGARPLWEPDEGRYAETAREMLVGGDWLVPHLQGVPHLTKPPLAYWLIAAGLKLLGMNAWGARLFLDLAFFLTILCVVALARTWGWSPGAARAAGLVYSTALLSFACSNIVSTDQFLTLWETLGVLCAWKVWSGAPRRHAWRLGFWAAFGLAFLTKGPPGWLPLLVIWLYQLRVKPIAPDRKLFSFPGFLLFLALAFGWYLAVVLKELSRLDYFLREEVFNRVFTGEHGRSKSPVFYFWVIPLGLAPWVFLWPALLRRALRRLRRGRGWRGWRAGWNALEPVHRFSALWFAVPLLVFTLSNSKMYLYVVPLMAPVALWAGRLLVERWGAPWPPAGEGSRRARLRYRTVAAAWLALMAAVRLMPDSAPRTRSHVELSRQILALEPRPDRLYSETSPPNSISFYTGLPITELDLDEEQILPHLHNELAAGRQIHLILKRDDLDDLLKFGWRELAGDDRLALITARELD